MKATDRIGSASSIARRSQLLDTLLSRHLREPVSPKTSGVVIRLSGTKNKWFGKGGNSPLLSMEESLSQVSGQRIQL